MNKSVGNKKYLTKVISQAAPILKAAGYRKVLPRTFNCAKEKGLIHVINFQANEFGDSFTVNLAVFVKELAQGNSYKIDESRIQESNCIIILRWRIGDISPKKYDYWWPYKSFDKTSKEVNTYIFNYALKFLEQYASRELLYKSVKKMQKKMVKKFQDYVSSDVLPKLKKYT